jgi:HAD superfamily hydrolase (TIGR01549 family)
MRIDAVILDWDGVLNDSVHAMYEAYSIVLEKLRLPKITFSEFRGLWESDYRKFEEKIGVTEDKRRISDKVWFDSYTKLMGRVNLFPGAKDFLTKIKKKHRIGLVTVGSLKRITREMNRYRLENVFDSIITGDDSKKLKPDPEALFMCANELKVNPTGCVYIGDTKGDVLAARNANMIPIAVTWGYHDISVLEGAKPKYIAEDFNELYDIINTL